LADIGIGMVQDFTSVGCVHRNEDVLPRGVFCGNLSFGFGIGLA